VELVPIPDSGEFAHLDCDLAEGIVIAHE